MTIISSEGNKQPAARNKQGRGGGGEENPPCSTSSPCPVSISGFCSRHNCFHKGRAYELSQLNNDVGEKYRRHWDKRIFYKRYPDEIEINKEIIDIKTPGRDFNNSIIKWNDKYLMTYRTGYYNSRLSISELNENWQVLWSKPLTFPFHPHHACAQEDARFFAHREELYLNYTGLDGSSYEHSRASQMICRLNKNLEVDKVYYPHYQKRNSHEKNWQLFNYKNELYAVYSIVPHKILKIDLEKETAKLCCETSFSVSYPWNFGFLRGGANPIPLRNGLHSFFHWTVIPPPGITKTYAMGVYEFTNVPPFEIINISNGSILVNKDNNRPKNWHMNVTFPCGAFIENGYWVVSYGSYDSWCSVVKFKIEDVDETYKIKSD